MKKSLFLLLLVGILVSDCRTPSIKGSGIASSEERETGYVSRIDVRGNYLIDVTCGKTNSLKIDAEDNILPLLETKVDNEKLTIKSTQPITALREIKISITTHTLEQIVSKGKSDINVKGLKSDKLDVSLDGEGIITLEGNVGDFNLSLDGDSQVMAKDLMAKKTKVSLYGDGKAEIFTSKYLDASVKGQGVIDYYGNPEEIRIIASKGGSVNKK